MQDTSQHQGAEATKIGAAEESTTVTSADDATSVQLQATKEAVIDCLELDANNCKGALEAIQALR